MLEEIVTNVISYAHDDGRPFDPLGAPPLDTAARLDQRAGGGAGIHLVRRFADDVRYRRHCGRNIVAVVMKRTEEKQRP